MCLPCFPFSDVWLESDSQERPRDGAYQYVWDGKQWALKHVPVSTVSLPPLRLPPVLSSTCPSHPHVHGKAPGFCESYAKNSRGGHGISGYRAANWSVEVHGRGQWSISPILFEKPPTPRLALGNSIRLRSAWRADFGDLHSGPGRSGLSPSQKAITDPGGLSYCSSDPGHCCVKGKIRFSCAEQ